MILHRRSVTVLQLAQGERLRNNRATVCVEDILCAILREGTSSIAKTMLDLGVTLEKLNQSQRCHPPQPASFLRQCLFIASQEAIDIGDSKICPIHLFLAMTRTIYCSALISKFPNPAGYSFMGQFERIREIAIENYLQEKASLGHTK